LCRFIVYAIETPSLRGVYNAVASNPVTNKEFTKALGKVLHRPILPFTVPSFLLKLILGEKATMVLEGQRVSNKKIIEAGFQFRFNKIEEALENIFLSLR